MINEVKNEINFDNYEINYPSIFIPKININTTKKHVSDVFNNLQLGEIKNVNFIKNKDTMRCCVHFVRWFDTPNAVKARKILISDKDIKVLYDGLLFWKGYANRSVKNATPYNSNKSKNNNNVEINEKLTINENL